MASPAPTFRELYPLVEPFDTFQMAVDEPHVLYVEQSGNPEGKPILVVHGGPGGGCPPFYRQYFDPSKYRVIMFDQRGAGQSTPASCLIKNTTWDLVADIELIRERLKIDKWVVFGGSWGSTLSLAYAQTHTDRVKALVLRGIFTLRRSELEFFYQGRGANHIWPDAWEKYIEVIPEVERADIMSAYHRRLTGDDEEEKLKCAKAWSTWEMATCKLEQSKEALEKGDEADFALKFARIECHYFVNGGFFTHDGQLLDNAAKLNGKFPITIVQGRYDCVCPATTAWELQKQLPDAEFYMELAGHSASEPAIRSRLLDATDKYASL
eukprot:TRINITY_DN466_c0_g1_i2.p1 TRINITY_DN466_c0_g1~~TRINITY_DN466_c0_g1_i2.p1  ORF type:complete len:324 (-),score=71.50 TRINITY_DN466_c0_g1_i2:52-1023(-)